MVNIAHPGFTTFKRDYRWGPRETFAGVSSFDHAGEQY